jgi:trans-aconitate methyltransferase
MAGYDEATYGERIADVYDELPHVKAQETEPAVEFLASLASRGPVLELAIGTGRVALPLKQRGVDIRGIDASPRMVEKLRAKPGGRDIPVSMGNFAEVSVDGRYSLIFIVFNTLFALLSQEEQLRCFGNVASHLLPGGAFVIECFVPDVQLLARQARLDVSRVDADEVFLNATTYQLLEQRATSMHIFLSGSGVQMYPVQVRYAWPPELDLMGRLAGLRLRERWAGWRREPFGEGSRRHISVYEPV